MRLILWFLTYSIIFIQEYTLQVNLNRLGQRSSKSIHCPKFPKVKDEGWFLTLGNQYDGELIALKRIGYRNNRSSHQLGFMAPAMKGTLYRMVSCNLVLKQLWFIGRLVYTLYLISDGYIGLDQQYNIQLDIIQPNAMTKS